MAISDPRSAFWAEACAMIERAEHLQRQFFRPFAAPQPATWEPPVDLFESDRDYWIVAALPGVEADGLSVSIEGDMLTVAGLRRLPDALRHSVIHRLEIPYGRFERRIRMPVAGLKVSRSELACGCLVLSFSKSI